MPRKSRLTSEHTIEILSPFRLLESICDQFKGLWLDKDILIWKISGSAPDGLITLVKDDSTSLPSEACVYTLKTRLGNSFKQMPSPSFKLIYINNEPDIITVQIKLSGLNGPAEASLEMDNPKDNSLEGALTDQAFLVSISNKGKGGQPLDEIHTTLLKICMEQLLKFNQLYSLLHQFKIQLKKFRHDFRTPLTSVSMIGGLLESDENEEIRQMGQMLCAATEKLDRLLKDFKISLEG